MIQKGLNRITHGFSPPPYVPQSVTFHNFVIQAGTDASLVPTELSTINATVRLSFRNTGTFFGVHVTAQPVTFYYSQLLMASGDVRFLSSTEFFS